MTNRQYDLRRIVQCIEALRDMSDAQARWHSASLQGDSPQMYAEMYDGQVAAYNRVLALLEAWSASTKDE